MAALADPTSREFTVRTFHIFIIFILASAPAAAAEKPSLNQAPLPVKLLAPNARPMTAVGLCFLEGPAADVDGSVYFSDITGNRILKLGVEGKLAVFRADSGRTNGNAFDAQGRLISCEGAENGPGGRRRLVRTDLKTGALTVLTDRYDGKRYNSPNDVCIDWRGRVWFSDPRYGLDRSDLEMDVEAVYRVDPDGRVARVLRQPEVERPNGLAVSPDGKTLYVVDSHPRPGGNRKIWAFDVKDDGTLDGQRLVYDFGKGRGGDGLRIDVDGNLWVAAGILTPRGPGETTDVPPGVYVITPQGKLLGRIPILEDVITNLTFGGPERKTLFVTAGKTLYQLPVRVAGAGVWPPLKK